MKELFKKSVANVFPSDWLSPRTKGRLALNMVDNLVKTKNSTRLSIVLQETTNSSVLQHAERVLRTKSKKTLDGLEVQKLLEITKRNPYYPSK